MLCWSGTHENKTSLFLFCPVFVHDIISEKIKR